MIGFILADLRRLWLGGIVVVLLVALATALDVAVTLQERSLRLGSARAADKFDLVIGAAGSETQLILSSIFLQAAPLPLVDGAVLTKLAADPRVAWAAPVGFGDSFAGYPIVGTTMSLVSNTTSGFAEGRMFALEGEAILGAAVDLSLGAEIKPMHGTAETGGHTHTEIAYKVVGKLQPTGTPWDRAILVPIQAVWHVHGLVMIMAMMKGMRMAMPARMMKNITTGTVTITPMKAKNITKMVIRMPKARRIMPKPLFSWWSRSDKSMLWPSAQPLRRMWSLTIKAASMRMRQSWRLSARARPACRPFSSSPKRSPTPIACGRNTGPVIRLAFSRAKF